MTDHLVCMNTNPKISIVVPVYKVEPYLQRCIDSVLTQDFEDWEMILVDDGSPDNCPAICDSYSSAEKRITVIHKTNGGLPSARQAGFAKVRGEYLVHLDSDDWLLPNALRILFAEIEKGYDIVKSRPHRVRDDGKEWDESYPVNVGIYEDCYEYGRDVILNRVHPYLHSGIYRTSLFSIEVFEPVIDNNIKIGEDWFTNMLILDRVKAVSVIDKQTHAYYVNSGSIMGTTVYSLKINELLDSVLRCYLSNLSRDLEYYLGVKKTINIFRLPFLPENAFDGNKYIAAYNFYMNNKDIVKQNIDNRFLLFVECRWIYQLYTFIYKKLFLYLRLNGNRRYVFPV